ncbi:sugar ABC transporter substrate-binding protein [Streptomyces sp. So13.3]|uniref:sugar ABC transporter substrate-binding protein n=1 Tax=Streptomyces TaxID=1883 RepID=UPI001105C78B|nr:MULTISPECIES: sugar ABC transporter substrate-binding protein [Streptomyces]MCZ4103400.1 sugar ABC transporter substrate-binding protein [Streptomyces sp. H39-C1]QNA77023.1 sugar ABC transporter substrate-binding protein [Streptomyces sp. So13.3]
MIRKPVVLSATAALLLATALTSCGQEGDGATSDGTSKGGKPTVCLVMKSLGNEYFQTMEKGAQDHARQRGDLTLTASGIQNETDIDGQVAAINRCITDKAAALVLAPADSQALVAPLKRAVKAGIKVVNIDVKLDDAALKAAGLDVPFVGPDNTEGARLSGAVLAKALGKDGKVVILEGNPGAANAQQRKAGFVAAAAAGGLRVLDSKTAHWETDEAYTVVSNMLTAHPDLQGILASNDSMALGAVKAVAAAGKKNQIKVASFDNIEAIRPYVKDGSVVATVDQFAAKQAGDGIDQAMKLIAGDKVQGWVKTDVKVITASDLG